MKLKLPSREKRTLLALLLCLVMVTSAFSVFAAVTHRTMRRLRAALSAPDSFSCARCKQLAFARSRLTYLKKKKSGVSAYLKWLPYAALCALRNLRGGT